MMNMFKKNQISIKFDLSIEVCSIIKEKSNLMKI